MKLPYRSESTTTLQPDKTKIKGETKTESMSNSKLRRQGQEKQAEQLTKRKLGCCCNQAKSHAYRNKHRTSSTVGSVHHLSLSLALACVLVGAEESGQGRDEIAVVDDAEVVFYLAV